MSGGAGLLTVLLAVGIGVVDVPPAVRECEHSNADLAHKARRRQVLQLRAANEGLFWKLLPPWHHQPRTHPRGPEPLRSLEEIAALLELQLVFPSGMPRRARRMLDELRLVGVNVSTEYEVMQLLNRLEGSDRWTKALGMLRVPSERRVVLVPPVTCSTHGPYSFSRRHTFSSSSTVLLLISTHTNHIHNQPTHKKS